ncbi:ChbG/HpnK family deacetylase [Candidatus Stoquefichus sp. SB1]|uniref:ChbG/HpnK family deacetylase n=1 Tax=Candidatus Stoquefichus sp. SB1 TaxID=1658109 RepID=UPI00067ECB6A|nr:ChbG/HpnK family deacetylase [Candidatus Stoquefichus sp. SB1]
MKLIMRADDLGFSEAVNYGILKSIVDGVITSTGMMPNMESAKHGYELVKNLDIALGQHTNICVGKPLSDPALIPSLVQKNGEFCSSKEIRARKEDSIVVEEAEIEIEAQLQRFIEITGRKPDYFEGHAVFSENFFKALKNVADKHGLFFCNPSIDKEWEKENHLYGLPFFKLDSDGLYDPKEYMQDNFQLIKENECSVAIFHPGYLDQYILTHSSFTKIRAMECDFLCSEWLKQWICDHQIELVNFKNYQK